MLKMRLIVPTDFWYLWAGNGHSSLLVVKAPTDGDPWVDIVLQLPSEQTGGGLVLDVARRLQQDLRLGPVGVLHLKRVFREPEELQLALHTGWWSMIFRQKNKQKKDKFFWLRVSNCHSHFRFCTWSSLLELENCLLSPSHPLCHIKKVVQIV